ncbi:hypothetical protein PybrP1_002237 [[Pythium] brassicae (nom. inval.)]|nr:hypothetical protein PybrP1_002237 [[Pythium] brassicae (nom. inval.)]
MTPASPELRAAAKAAAVLDVLAREPPLSLAPARPTTTTTTTTTPPPPYCATAAPPTAVASHTCATFLHIMKEFSESSCDASEVLQRVDSLAHQDAQLLRLLPLAGAAAGDNKTDDRAPRRRSDSVAKAEEVMDAERTSVGGNHRPVLLRRASDCSESDCSESDCGALAMDVDDGRMASPRSVDLQRPASALRRTKVPAALMGADDDNDADDDHETRAAKRQRENDKEMDAHDELQRWIELDLELDHRMEDVFDFTKDHAHGHLGASAAAAAATASSLPTLHSASASFARLAGASPYLSSSLQSSSSSSSATAATAALQAASFLRTGPSAAALQPKRAGLGSAWHKANAAPFDKNAQRGSDRTARAKLLASAGTSGGATREPVASASASAAAERQQREREAKCDDENMWGMEDDEYQQGLLSSIDHSVLCDRENRFLQWDLEMETQAPPPPPTTSATTTTTSTTTPTPPPSAAFGSFSPHAAAPAASGPAAAPDWAKSKWLLASSPREKAAKSPSNVDIVDDWNSLDFGTFQNRTVSHILSSCLNKRKLHHPYKNQVKLVNFNMSGDAAIADPIEPTPPALHHHYHHHSGSLASSLAFGARPESELRAAGGSERMGDVGGSCSSGVIAAFGAKDSGHSSAELFGKAALLKGEKKSKKREERKRLMSLKMQETFADLEGTFTEQDLDFKNVAGAGSLSKMALAKLEALPLPDLSNLPQDLKELKRKIEATEHKVEGTKHRHRKGGPCPRCQVQNQLRAAKRAYHKRAVAHKKLPQSGSSLTMAEAADATDLMFTSPPLTPTASPSFDGASPSLSPMSTASSSSSSPALTAAKAGGAPLLPVVLPAAAPAKLPVATPPFAKPAPAYPPTLLVAVSSSTPAAGSGLLQPRPLSAAGPLVKSAAARPLATAPGAGVGAASVQVGAGARPGSGGFQPTAPRRPCGNTFAASSSSSSSSSTASASPSASESASSPHVQHVTVTSA